jgi:hypothetical protein
MVAPKQPPAPIAEEPPDQQPEGAVWIPGYWSWDSDSSNYIWVSGVWRVPPPGRQWVPGYWTQTDNGWQWVSGFWADAQRTEAPYQPAPPAPLDNGPSAPAPDDNSIYVPGSWVYRSSQFVWRPGYWRPARLGWVWTPASYCWTPSGYVFVDGYWDYPLEERGLLFAPVAIDQPVVGGVFAYRPRFVVDINALLGCLFVRPGCGYYFGDYYAPAYVNAGWSPWISWGLRFCDPLFGYYRWSHGRGWFDGLNALNTGRFNGTLVRPGRTLVEQNTIIQKNINNRSVVNNVTLVNSLNNRNSNVRLTQLNRAQVLEHQNIARNINRQGNDRLKSETARGRSASLGKWTLPTSPHPVVRSDVIRKPLDRKSITSTHPQTLRPQRTPRIDHTATQQQHTVHTPLQQQHATHTTVQQQHAVHTQMQQQHTVQQRAVHTQVQQRAVHTQSAQRAVPHVQAQAVHQAAATQHRAAAPRPAAHVAAKPAPRPAARPTPHVAAKPAARPAGKKK